MHKFFTEEIDENFAYISGDDHKHLSRVLRLRVGDTVIINNLMGDDFLGIIESIEKQSAKIELKEKMKENNESSITITLYQGMPKAGKMDIIVQKSTELGVNRIVPIITERVVVKNGAEYKKLDRLRRISVEAAKQSKRSIIPVIAEPMKFQELLNDMKKSQVLIVPYENKDNYGFAALKKELAEIKSCGILIGPEGGFTDEEIRMLEDHGAKIITLGKRILRTETAGFTAIAMTQLIYGDMGGKV